MAQNVTIAGASYSDVPAVDIPKTGGGTAVFVDSSDANATASDILSGKTAYVDGVKVTGTGSGGGGTKVVSQENQDGTQNLVITDPASGSTSYISQAKTVSPSTSQQVVSYDSGFDGLSQVLVQAIQTETTTATANGTYTPTSGKFLSQVVVAVPTYNGGVS